MYSETIKIFITVLNWCSFIHHHEIIHVSAPRRVASCIHAVLRATKIDFPIAAVSDGDGEKCLAKLPEYKRRH